MRMKGAEAPKPRRFDEGGAVGRDGEKEYAREHAEELSADERTRKYDREFRHYYGDGEKGFARGGRVRRYDEGGAVDDSLSPHHQADRDEEDAEYQRMASQLAPTADKRPAVTPKEKQPRAYAFASGGRAPDYPPGSGDAARVDGSGKVDGVHSNPAECSHLAAGGVCRHQPAGRKPRGSDHSDGPRVRNFASGGSVSFGRYLAQRKAGRSKLRGL